MTRKIVFCFFLAALFLIPKISDGEDGYQNERIKDFAVEIKIDEDSKINISEKITYDFGENQKHGIFRFVPIKYKARGGILIIDSHLFQ